MKPQAYRVTAYIPPGPGTDRFAGARHISVIVAAIDLPDALATFLVGYPTAKVNNVVHVAEMFDPPKEDQQ